MGTDGFVVPQRDAHALAGAISVLIDRPERRAALGASAAATIRSRFDVSTCELPFHQLVNAVVSTAP